MSVSLLAEDYAVYHAALSQKSVKTGRERFVIEENLCASGSRLHGQETIQSKIVHWRLKLKGLEEATVHDFVRKHHEDVSLEQKFNLPLPCVLLSESESTEIWNRQDKESLRGRLMDGWKIFRERYPGADGVISFSRIGFNDHKDQALLEMGIQVDGLMGDGGLLLFSRRKSGWKVCNELPLWIS